MGSASTWGRSITTETEERLTPIGGDDKIGVEEL
jgi:hypothetical protein